MADNPGLGPGSRETDFIDHLLAALRHQILDSRFHSTETLSVPQAK